jgi:hypothetical protein
MIKHIYKLSEEENKVNNTKDFFEIGDHVITNTDNIKGVITSSHQVYSMRVTKYLVEYEEDFDEDDDDTFGWYYASEITINPAYGRYKNLKKMYGESRGWKIWYNNLMGYWFATNGVSSLTGVSRANIESQIAQHHGQDVPDEYKVKF